MREIKFRVWSNCWNLMIYLDGFKYVNDRIIQIYYKDEDEDISSSVVSLKDAIIEQYTGLKDKNGKEIYEGDILEFSTFDYNGADTQHIGVVYWCDGEFLVDGTQKGDDEEVFSLSWVFQDSELEVIGNKFENPDLLKGE